MMEVEQIQRLTQGEDVLGTVGARQRLADGLFRGAAPDIAKLGELLGRMVARDDRPDDAHPDEPRNIRNDMMELYEAFPHSGGPWVMGKGTEANSAVRQKSR